MSKENSGDTSKGRMGMCLWTAGGPRDTEKHKTGSMFYNTKWMPEVSTKPY